MHVCVCKCLIVTRFIRVVRGDEPMYSFSFSVVFFFSFLIRSFVRSFVVRLMLYEHDLWKHLGSILTFIVSDSNCFNITLTLLSHKPNDAELETHTHCACMLLAK